MSKTLKSITDAEGQEMKFSAGNLELPPHCPLETSKSPSPKTRETKETRICSTYHFFSKVIKSSLHNFLNDLEYIAIKFSRYSKYLPQ